ncbi:MAG: gliding motility-associated C-terminal domain-containing protein [Cyclobacteriaceae bacterium]|nr:gliding motility-associated C-terminal domain-containing protein [Cyclobacteriaceae bacterium]
MGLNWRKVLILSGISVLGYFSAVGSHLRAGNISITRQNCSSTEFRILVVLYADMGSPVIPGGGILNFGDGTLMTTTSGDFVRGANLPNQVSVYTLDVLHTYSASNQPVLVSYEEPNRNGGILNIANSAGVPFYLESVILVSSTLCNSTPVLFSPPVDIACHKIAFQHNPAAFDADGDSLSFHLAVPKRSRNTEVDYASPDNESFYSNFASGSEDGLNPPSIMIDPVSGMLVWDAPGAIGEYNVAFIVNEWRKINGNYTIIGFVRRDMQIIVAECSNRPPELIIPQDLCIYVGEFLEREFTGIDPDGNPVKVEVFSGIFDHNSNPTVVPQIPQFSIPPSLTTFKWVPNCNDVRNQPYQVVIKITDNPTHGYSIARFKIWNIRVAAQAPEVNEPVLDVIARNGTIFWSPYICSNASSIVIWRRVGKFDYIPDKCIAGVPEYAGYIRIAEVDPGQTSFIDDNFGQGLAPGAVYCYRITAIFPLAGGAESEVSVEKCMPPVLAEAPVITKVSVDKTSKETGTVSLKWYSPYDLDFNDFEGQYEYVVLRTVQGGLTDFIPITTASIVDTVFVDYGLNTESFSYAYKIVLLAKGMGESELIPLDSSTAASSVWNITSSEDKAISLSWFADVPWSNTVQANPWHLVYRQSEDEDEFILMDSVNVVENGFSYTDRGTFNAVPLEDQKFYCYKILTRGSYGNPDIESPLENFSQVMCSTTFDDTPPCIPLVKGALDCKVLVKEWSCNQQYFDNELLVEHENIVCDADVYYYKIYAVETDQLQLIDISFSPAYVHSNLNSKSKCYRVSSVDRAGNESDLSEMVCFDNCPTVYFPNVFTPDGDMYNQFFTTINNEPYCTRFVERISLKILNRWGQTVVDIPSAGSVQWNGRDNKGREVDTGIYFFIANIEFQVSNQKERFSEVKGWVQLMK